MRAVVRDRYGPPGELRVADLPEPRPEPGRVVVQVRAASVNRADWELVVGRPLYARIGGLRRPAHRTLGTDLAGTVTAVGAGVTTFEPGDEVYGRCRTGAFAERAVARADALLPRPAEITPEVAATLPESGAIALQGTEGIRPGDRVLVNGAGGGSGTLAVQLAVLAGAHVTGVDNAGKLDLVRSLGAHEAFDHQHVDYTRQGPFDLVLDLVADRSVLAYRRALARGGRFRYVGGSVPTLLSVLTAGRALGLVTGRDLRLLAVRQAPAGYAPLAARVATGDVHVQIDSVVALEEVPEAIARVGEGRARGKVVVRP